MARFDGHFAKLGWLGLWAVLFTCVAASKTFSGLSTTWAQNGSTPPFEIHCLAEIMLWPSGGMPLTVFFNISMTRSSPLSLFGQCAGFLAHDFVQSLVQVTTSL